MSEFIHNILHRPNDETTNDQSETTENPVTADGGDAAATDQNASAESGDGAAVTSEVTDTNGVGTDEASTNEADTNETGTDEASTDGTDGAWTDPAATDTSEPADGTENSETSDDEAVAQDVIDSADVPGAEGAPEPDAEATDTAGPGEDAETDQVTEADAEAEANLPDEGEATAEPVGDDLDTDGADDDAATSDVDNTSVVAAEGYTPEFAPVAATDGESAEAITTDATESDVPERPAASSRGLTTVDDAVLAKLVRAVATKVEGVHSLDDAATSVEVTDDVATISVVLVTEFGSPVRAVAERVRTEVIEAVEQYVGQDVDALNVTVSDIHLPDAS